MRALIAAAVLSGVVVAATARSPAGVAESAAVRLIQTSDLTFQVEWEHTRLTTETGMVFQAQLWTPEVGTGTRISNTSWREDALTAIAQSAGENADGDPTLETTWRSPEIALPTTAAIHYTFRLRARLPTPDGTKSSAWAVLAFDWPLDGEPPPLTLRPPGKPRAHR